MDFCLDGLRGECGLLLGCLKWVLPWSSSFGLGLCFCVLHCGRLLCCCGRAGGPSCCLFGLGLFFDFSCGILCLGYVFPATFWALANSFLAVFRFFSAAFALDFAVFMDAFAVATFLFSRAAMLFTLTMPHVWCH